jgi:hypothetical protein
LPEPDKLILERMLEVIKQWEDQSDQRAIFLNCYAMMTRNMLSAIEQQEFKDPAWVDRLLHRFADYYFIALDAYEHNPSTAPPVWQVTHDITQTEDRLVLQKLLLGVNAHINYDLVFTLVELLEPEWAELSETRRAERYADHCYVNEVIGRTIDAVQDTVLEPAMPVMDIVDKLLGPLDEMMLSRLITNWRDRVWNYAILLLETKESTGRWQVIQQVEAETFRQAEAIIGKDWSTAFGELL